VCVSDVALFSVLLAIMQFLPCEVLIFLVFQFSHHILGATVCVSHFPRFSVFSPQSRSYNVHLSFFMFFHVSRHIPGPII
jgi:hypothetical protein